jgi:hypothetical protein
MTLFSLHPSKASTRFGSPYVLRVHAPVLSMHASQRSILLAGSLS